MSLFVTHLAWLIGDPHVSTLDNLRYTFNGLGEYILCKGSTGNIIDNFILQGYIMIYIEISAVY